MTYFWTLIAPFMVAAGSLGWFLTPPMGWRAGPKRALTAPATKHTQCLADIARLERELADDGVMFLKSDLEFDREIERVTTAWRTQQAPVIAPPLRPKVLGGVIKNASAICPIGGTSYANCACDPRWAQIYYCPARRGQ